MGIIDLGKPFVGFARQQEAGVPVWPEYFYRCRPLDEPAVELADDVAPSVIASQETFRRTLSVRVLRQRTLLTPDLLETLKYLLTFDLDRGHDHDYTVILTAPGASRGLRAVDAKMHSYTLHYVDDLWFLDVVWLITSFGSAADEEVPHITVRTLPPAPRPVITWGSQDDTRFERLALTVYYLRHPMGHRRELQRAMSPKVQICVHEKGVAEQALMYYSEDRRPSINFDLTAGCRISLPYVAVNFYQTWLDESAWSGVLLNQPVTVLVSGG